MYMAKLYPFVNAFTYEHILLRLFNYLSSITEEYTYNIQNKV